MPLSSDNPYQLRLAEELAKLKLEVSLGEDLKQIMRLARSELHVGRPILHLHWLSRFHGTIRDVCRPLAYLFRLGYLRWRGFRIVWTVHNLYAHEAKYKWVDRLVTIIITKLVSSIVVHSPAAREIVAKEFVKQDTRKMSVIPHGNYIGMYCNNTSSERAREKLSLPKEKIVMGFIGSLRPYKGVDRLIMASQLAAEVELCLLIAGRPMDQIIQSQIANLANQDRRIVFCPEYIRPDDLQFYYNACDVIVLPYLDVLTSGALILAMSFGRPCIAPRLGCIPEYLGENAGILYEPNEAQPLASALRRAVEVRDELPAMGRRALARAQRWNWRDVAAATAQCYGFALDPAEVVLLEAARTQWWT